MMTYSEKRDRLKNALLACKANFNRNSVHDMIMASWSSLLPGSGLNFSDVKFILDEVFGPVPGRIEAGYQTPVKGKTPVP